MPLSGLFVTKLLRLPSHYAAGLILLACCLRGTMNNIVTSLARGNVALSVLMTTASTISTVVMTPFLIPKIAEQFVSVNAAGLFMSTMQVVSPLMPFTAVTTVAILCGSAIAKNASAKFMSGRQVVLAVCALYALGSSLGDMKQKLHV